MDDRKKSVIISALVAFTLTVLIAVVCSLTQNTAVLIGFLGAYVSIAISLLFDSLNKIRQLRETNQVFGKVINDQQALDFCTRSVNQLAKSAGYTDQVYKGLLKNRLNNINNEMDKLSSGVFEFKAESWRKPWRELLSRKEVKLYRSVSLVKSERYWQDKPGKESIEFNKSIAGRVCIERIFIIWDNLWESDKIKEWILDQKQGGIKVFVVKKSELPAQEELLHDFGIYGDIAVGYQILDEECNTLKFKLSFNKDYYLKTEERFNQLKVYSTEDSTRDFLSLINAGVTVNC